MDVECSRLKNIYEKVGTDQLLHKHIQIKHTVVMDRASSRTHPLYTSVLRENSIHSHARVYLRFIACVSAGLRSLFSKPTRESESHTPHCYGPI